MRTYNGIGFFTQWQRRVATKVLQFTKDSRWNCIIYTAAVTHGVKSVVIYVGWATLCRQSGRPGEAAVLIVSRKILFWFQKKEGKMIKDPYGYAQSHQKQNLPR